jgi:hypothetical protein
LRLAGQNPTNEEIEKILEDANAPGTMIDVNDLLSIAEKHWKLYGSFEIDLKQACLAFGRLNILLFGRYDVFSHIKIVKRKLYLMNRIFMII